MRIRDPRLKKMLDHRKRVRTGCQDCPYCSGFHAMTRQKVSKLAFTNEVEYGDLEAYYHHEINMDAVSVLTLSINEEIWYEDQVLIEQVQVEAQELIEADICDTDRPGQWGKVVKAEYVFEQGTWNGMHVTSRP